MTYPHVVAADRAEPTRTLRRIRWRVARRDLRVVAVAAVTLSTAGWAARALGVVVNHSASFPRGLYVVRRLGDLPPHERPAAPPRNALVVWCLPAQLAAFARGRGYIGGGDCPGGGEAVLKMVAARPGDTVEVRAGGLLVNGMELANSRPLATDSRGRPTLRFASGTRIVARREAWLWSPHESRSFDSRYFGGVPLDGWIGAARPLWTWR